MTSNPYDALAAVDVEDSLSDRPRTLVTLRVAVAACVLSALAGSGTTWAVMASTSAPAASGVVISPTNQPRNTSSGARLPERNPPP